MTDQREGWPGDKRYLTRKAEDGVWYATIDVPRPLQEIVGKKRFMRSLKTRSLGEAQRRRWAVVASFHEEIAAKAAADTSTATARHDEHVRMALQAREELREIDDHEGRSDYSDMILSVASNIRDTRQADQFQEIALGLADPVELHVERYLATTTFTDRTKADMRTAVSGLLAWTKSAKKPGTVQKLTSRIAGEYRDALVAAKTNTRTTNKKISLLSGYWRWLGTAGIIDPDRPNPWKGKSLPKPKAWRDDPEQSTAMRPFTDNEVTRLLSGDMPNADMLDLMKIAALSGMRLEEIGQLRVADCVDDVFNIRKSKTKAGLRKVPTHSDLAGIIAKRTKDKAQDAFIFPDFTASGWDDARTMAISKAFGRYRKKVGVNDTPDGSRRSRVDFHSFRRWFARKCEEAGQQQTIVARVMGHETGIGITFGTYSQAQPLDLMRTCVESVKLPPDIRNLKGLEAA
jgi:integrase